MKSILAAALTIGVLAAIADAQDSSILKTQKEKISYGIGVDVGRNFKNLGLDIDPEILFKGFKDAFAGSKLAISDDELGKVMSAYQSELMNKQARAMKEKAEENKKKGEAFLAGNKGKEGVVTLPSGLQYKILKAADGKKPTANDTVVCNYRGTLIDGTEFDSSYKRGQPASFKVAGVIPGWTEALKLMPVGSKWQLFIPSQLAYGERSMSREIGPNSTLVFEVELIEVK